MVWMHVVKTSNNVVSCCTVVNICYYCVYCMPVLYCLIMVPSLSSRHPPRSKTQHGGIERGANANKTTVEYLKGGWAKVLFVPQ